MRKDKWKQDEKNLCKQAEGMMEEHVSNCNVCKTSFESSQAFGIPTSPPCNKMLTILRSHVDSCNECQNGQRKWNDDSIPITPEMRLVVSQLQSGKMPEIGLMKSVASQLTKELGLTSDEIGRMNETAREKVNKFLKGRFGNEQV